MKKGLGKKLTHSQTTIEAYSGCPVCNYCGCRTCVVDASDKSVAGTSNANVSNQS